MCLLQINTPNQDFQEMVWFVFHFPLLFVSLILCNKSFFAGNGDDWDFGNRKGFLALAHPSPMHIGTGHGVYVLTERNNKLDTGL